MSTETRTVDLPGTPMAARTARRFVRAVAGAALGVRRADRLDNVELCAGELFANAIQHTASGRGGRVVLTVSTAGDAVRVTVTDDGGADTKPRVQAEDFRGEGGRGLWLVDRIAMRWGVEELDRGNTVWAEFPLGRDPAASEQTGSHVGR